MSAVAARRREWPCLRGPSFLQETATRLLTWAAFDKRAPYRFIQAVCILLGLHLRLVSLAALLRQSASFEASSGTLAQEGPFQHYLVLQRVLVPLKKVNRYQ